MGRPTDEQIAGWYPRLFRAALRMTGDVDAAADLTQQTFCKALNRWDRFCGSGLRSTWLHRILVNCFVDWMRQRRIDMNVSERVDEWALLSIVDRRGQAPEDLERQEQMAGLRTAIADLPDTLRSAFIATVLDGYTYEETSEMLSVPVGTIASRVHSARKQLTQAIHRDHPETCV